MENGWISKKVWSCPATCGVGNCFKNGGVCEGCGWKGLILIWLYLEIWFWMWGWGNISGGWLVKGSNVNVGGWLCGIRGRVVSSGWGVGWWCGWSGNLG